MDIPKPKKIRANSPKRSENIYRWILEACNNKEYINAKLIGTNEDVFVNHIIQLEKDNYITIKQLGETILSNLDCQITLKGIASLRNKSYKFEFSPTIEFNGVKVL